MAGGNQFSFRENEMMRSGLLPFCLAPSCGAFTQRKPADRVSEADQGAVHLFVTRFNCPGESVLLHIFV